jgi:hypothetical protein
LETKYGFARADPGVAIAAADELARRYREGPMHRLNADGTIDVAVREGHVHRRFQLFGVGAEGTVVELDARSAPSEHIFYVALMAIGSGVFMLAILSIMLRQEAAGYAGFGVLVGFLAAFTGVVRANRFDVSWYVRTLLGTDEGWQQVVTPTTWAPDSLSQMDTVERLADEHRGKALVRREADGSVTTLTLRRGRMIRHRVTVDGGLELMSEGRRALRYALGASLMGLAIVGGVVTIYLHNFTEVDVDTAWNVCFGILVAGAVLCGTVTIEGTVGRAGSFGDWHLVQTKPDDPD